MNEAYVYLSFGMRAKISSPSGRMREWAKTFLQELSGASATRYLSLSLDPAEFPNVAPPRGRMPEWAKLHLGTLWCKRHEVPGFVGPAHAEDPLRSSQPAFWNAR